MPAKSTKKMNRSAKRSSVKRVAQSSKRAVRAVKPAASRAPAKETYAMLCAVCGSTSINTINSVNSCSDCKSTQLLTVPEGELHAKQNAILEHAVEERFHQYMEQKHTRIAGRKFMWILAAIIVGILIVAYVLQSVV